MAVFLYTRINDSLERGREGEGKGEGERGRKGERDNRDSSHISAPLLGLLRKTHAPIRNYDEREMERERG